MLDKAVWHRAVRGPLIIWRVAYFLSVSLKILFVERVRAGRYAFELEFGKLYLFKIYGYKPPIIHFL